MEAANRDLTEDIPIRFVLDEFNNWHWYDFCPKYPVSFLKVTYEKEGMVPEGELCRYCLLIELKMNLKNLLKR